MKKRILSGNWLIGLSGIICLSLITMANGMAETHKTELVTAAEKGDLVTVQTLNRDYEFIILIFNIFIFDCYFYTHFCTHFS